MAKVNYSELAVNVVTGNNRDIEVAVRDEMNDALGKEIPLSISFDLSVTVANTLVDLFKESKNVPMRDIEEFVRNFMVEFKKNFKRGYESATKTA